MLAYLRELGIVEPAVVPVPTQVDLLVARFVEYLARERGTTNRTSVYWYARIARSFLTGRVDPDSGMLAPLTAGDVTAFLLGECRHCSRWGGMRLVSSLRGLLRFLLVEGLVSEDLSAAVPRLPAWSLVRLPKALPAEHAARIVASCDRSTAAGCRDYAILMLLSRMGLRGCEISRLLLEDLDWRAGEVIVRGKRDYHERLPLPVDVGDALVDYLRHVRPRSRRSARVPDHGPSARAAQRGVPDCRPDRVAREQASRPGPGWRASFAAHGRDRGAAGRRAVGGDRVAASSSRLGDDDRVREGRLGPAQRARPPVAGGAGMTGLA